jgi:hypothetical protein
MKRVRRIVVQHVRVVIRVIAAAAAAAEAARNPAFFIAPAQVAVQRVLHDVGAFNPGAALDVGSQYTYAAH